jgi:hypothetical protein
MNYTELTALLQEYTQNYASEFVAALPSIIGLAEDRIYRSVQIPELKKNATSNLVAGTKYLNAPTDFLASYSIAVINTDGSYNYMLEKEVAFIGEVYPIPTSTGLPRFYALFNETTFLVGPTPNSSYQVELHYYYEPPSIVQTSTSWLGTEAESVLFYGCLLEAYVYMKGDNDLMALYKGRYDEALARLKNLGEGLNKRDNFRVDAPRVTPT